MCAVGNIRRWDHRTDRRPFCAEKCGEDLSLMRKVSFMQVSCGTLTSDGRRVFTWVAVTKKWAYRRFEDGARWRWQLGQKNVDRCT